MKNTCKACGRTYRIEPPYIDGQEIVCPYCGETNVYHTPSRIELPVDAVSRRESVDAVSHRESVDAVSHRVTEENDPSIQTRRDSASTGDGRSCPEETRRDSASTGLRDSASAMQPVSRLRVIRPTDGAQSARSAKDNALVDRVRSRSRAEGRRAVLQKIRIVFKDLFWIAVLTAIVYAIAAIAACLFLPARIADAEARQFGDRIAIARITRDLQLARERIRTIKSEVRERGLSKISETALILGDDGLNRIARTYLNTEWTGLGDAFIDRAVQSRARIYLRKKRAAESKESDEKKVRDLEIRKNMLSHTLQSPNGDQQREHRQAEIDAKLAKLREHEEVFKGDRRQNGNDSLTNEWERNEKALAELAAQHEKDTITALMKCMTVRLEQLQWKVNETKRLRNVAAIFDVWPISKFMKIPEGTDNEKRL